LDEESSRGGASFSEIVNHILRRELIAWKQPTRKPFVVTPRHLGLPAGLSYDKIEELLDALEGPTHQ